MKNRTRHIYMQRMDQVVALLQQAVDAGQDLPDPARLAEVAHISPFHFHRVYRALTGETPGGTVARLRMLRAVQQLASSELAVTDVALSAGYETPQAFARAFRQVCGATPSELRADPERQAAVSDQLARAPEPARQADTPLKVEVVSVVPFRVMAVRHRGSFHDLNLAYSKLYTWAAERGVIERIQGIFGLPLHDARDTPPEQTEFDAAVLIDAPVEAGDGVTAQIWGGGEWARARHVGPYEGLLNFTDRMLAEWFPTSGHTLRDVPIYREFLDDPEETPAALCRADVYLPVA